MKFLKKVYRIFGKILFAKLSVKIVEKILRMKFGKKI